MCGEMPKKEVTNSLLPPLLVQIRNHVFSKFFFLLKKDSDFHGKQNCTREISRKKESHESCVRNTRWKKSSRNGKAEQVTKPEPTEWDSSPQFSTFPIRVLRPSRFEHIRFLVLNFSSDAKLTFLGTDIISKLNENLYSRVYKNMACEIFECT